MKNTARQRRNIVSSRPRTQVFCGFGFFLSVLFSLPAFAGSPGKTLTFCVESADVRPWRTRDGHGLNFSLLDRVSLNIGVRFSYRLMSWPRCLAQLKSGTVDGAFAGSFKPDRLEAGAFPGGANPDISKRLHMDRYIVLRRQGSAVNWNGTHFTHLEGRIGTQLGYSINDFLRSQNLDVDDGAQTAEALVQKLTSGRVAAAAMLEGEIRSVLAEDARRAARVEIVPIPLQEKAYYLLLSHALEKDAPELSRAIWENIERVRESPGYREEERKAFASGTQGGH